MHARSTVKIDSCLNFCITPNYGPLETNLKYESKFIRLNPFLCSKAWLNVPFKKF